jgi:hypothetical protein
MRECMLRRVGILLLTLAFVVALTTQSVPHASAMDGCPMSAAAMAISSKASQSDFPCKGPTQACIDVMDCAACATAVALPVPPLSPTTLEWVAATYTASGISLSGLSVEPELTPPILVA